MTAVILALTVVFFVYLAVENSLAAKHRRAISHVVYVNGTRGKSSVTRLIDAGLRAGGLRTFCKTTGTLPMVIDTKGQEKLIHRRGRANIKEQLWVLSQAAGEGAQVLVAECMAVDPLYQRISQHQMVQADIGVITNVRLDHTDVMGETLPEIAQALSNTIPRNGIVFTGEQEMLPVLAVQGAALGTTVWRVGADGSIETAGGKRQDSGPLEQDTLEAIDFPENVALALAVCTHLGVDRETALAGMAGYQRDPYALSLHRIGRDSLFINGLSINDPQSSVLVYKGLEKKLGLEQKRLTLLLNNRGDRMSRTAQMVELAQGVAPQRIWLLGAGQRILTKRLRAALPDIPVTGYRSGAELPLDKLDGGEVVFAAGNIALQGKELMERVWKEGEAL